MPLKRRAAPRAEIMVWDGSEWVKVIGDTASGDAVRVRLRHGDTDIGAIGTDSDGKSNTISAVKAGAFMQSFNGSTWDRWRNNTNITVLPSATRTASGKSADQTNYNAKGVIIWLYISAVSGTFTAGEGLEVGVAAKDPVTGGFYYIAPRIGPYTTKGGRELLIYPGCTDTGGQFEGKNDVPLPRVWRVYYIITGTNPSFTFSVGASLIV